MITIEHDDYIIYIGRNACENWEILSIAQQNHLLFHLSHFPSPYVLLYPLKKLKETPIRLCAEMCKKYSKHSTARKVSVDYSPCSNIKRGKTIGEYYYKNNKKVSIIIL